MSNRRKIKAKKGAKSCFSCGRNNIPLITKTLFGPACFDCLARIEAGGCRVCQPDQGFDGVCEKHFLEARDNG